VPTVPWPYSTLAEFGNPARRNLPTEAGRALGAELARLATIERLHAEKDLPLPCRDCAFELGTDPNGSEETLMDAVKCIMEGETFNCHVDAGKPCAGFLALKLPAARLGAQIAPGG
jgi:hypothetical protein